MTAASTESSTAAHVAATAVLGECRARRKSDQGSGKTHCDQKFR
jgi:hypothetical protein